MLASGVGGMVSTVALIVAVLPTLKVAGSLVLVGIGGFLGFALLLMATAVTTGAMSAFRPGFVDLVSLGHMWKVLPILTFGAFMITSISGPGLLFLTLEDLNGAAAVAYVVVWALTPMPVVLPIMTMIALGVVGTARSFAHHPPVTLAEVFPRR